MVKKSDFIPSTHGTDQSKLDKIMEYSIKGFKYSQLPLIDAVCFKCSKLIWVAGSGSRKPKIVRLCPGARVPIEELYGPEYLEDIRYFHGDRKDGFMYACIWCHQFPLAPSPLDVFPIFKPVPGHVQYLMPGPEV